MLPQYYQSERRSRLLSEAVLVRVSVRSAAVHGQPSPPCVRHTGVITTATARPLARLSNTHLLLLSAVLVCALGACATDAPPPTGAADPPATPVTEVPRAETTDPPEDDESTDRPQLVPDEQSPVAPDLQRLARRFVSYAVGDSDSFPHGDSVSMSIGGQPVLSIDDIVAALSNREIWEICPADWDTYGATSCPVNLLGPIISAGRNNAALVHTAEYGDVTCAPARSGPLPPGRLVVLRPSEEWRTCASDFALVLAADERGQLRSIDLTLSEP